MFLSRGEVRSWFDGVLVLCKGKHDRNDRSRTKFQDFRMLNPHKLLLHTFRFPTIKAGCPKIFSEQNEQKRNLLNAECQENCCKCP